MMRKEIERCTLKGPPTNRIAVGTQEIRAIIPTRHPFVWSSEILSRLTYVTSMRPGIHTVIPPG